MKYLTELTIAWVDIAILGFIVVGVFQGRKRGLSGELLDGAKWLLIAAGAGFTHRPLADLLRQTLPSLSPLASYVIVYLAIVCVFGLVFSSIKHSVGEKLAQSELFGWAEYYAGMLMGGVRFACIALVMMSLIHARLYTATEVKAREKSQEDSFGSIRFFRLYKLQADVFQLSYIGRGVEQFMDGLLIQSTPPGGGAAAGESSAHKREKRVYEILDH